MHAHGARGEHDRTDHRPQKDVAATEAGYRQFGHRGGDVGVVERKRLAVGIGRLGPYEGGAACVMQVCVVQDGKARIVEQVRPDRRVRGGIAKLVDGQVVLAPVMPPDEVVRRLHADLPGCRRVVGCAPGGHVTTIDEDVDTRPLCRERGRQFDRTAGHAARLRRPRGKPRETHDVSLSARVAGCEQRPAAFGQVGEQLTWFLAVR